MFKLILLLLLYILVNAVSIDACAATGQRKQIAVPAKRTTSTTSKATTTTIPTTTTTIPTTTTTIPITTTTLIPPPTTTTTTSTTSTTTTTSCTTTTTSPIPCVCPPGTIQIFVNGDVPAAFTDNFCALASPSNTCASGTGQFRCYQTTTMQNPFGYCGSSAYAFNVLNSACASFCMCDSSGICYTPFNPGTMVRYRFAPFCNPSGVCCYTIFVENIVGATNSGLITSTGTIIDFNTQYNPPGVDLNFACSSAGPQVFDIVYVSCSGCPPTPTNPCTATG